MYSIVNFIAYIILISIGFSIVDNRSYSLKWNIFKNKSISKYPTAIIYHSGYYLVQEF